MKALVAEAQLPTAVAGLRALGRAGTPVVAVGHGPFAAGLWSRYAEARATSPDPVDDPRGFVHRIVELSGMHGPLALYPSSEGAIAAMLSGWDELDRTATLPYSGRAPLARIRDKTALPALAGSVELTAPRTLTTGTAAELATDPLPVPCVVKPAAPAGRRRGAHAIDTQAEFRRLLAAGRLPSGERLLVQERVRGRLTSVELVIDREGKPAARFMAEAERTSPRRAGLISFARSVPPDEELAERLAAMLAGAGYWGLAQVDVIVTRGGPTVIDVNPRFYSCLPLSLACGLNLPAIWHAVAAGESVPGAARYEAGVAYRWLEGELTEALRGEPRRLATPPARGGAGAMWARDDPASAAALAANAVTTRVRNGLGRLNRRRAGGEPGPR